MSSPVKTSTKLVVLLVQVTAYAVIVALSFCVGIRYSRSQIADLATAMEAQGPTNSFSRCLTEMWEQSGELDPQWKGKREWALVDTKPSVQP